VTNSHFNSHHGCICDDLWGGPGCYEFGGKCDPVCVGCTGLTNKQCINCIQHAGKDDYGICVCNLDWHGVHCNTYTGQCNPICLDSMSCVGPSKFDCEECVDNANETEHGECVCNMDWSGPNCM
jgi:hypothetical protein